MRHRAGALTFPIAAGITFPLTFGIASRALLPTLISRLLRDWRAGPTETSPADVTRASGAYHIDTTGAVKPVPTDEPVFHNTDSTTGPFAYVPGTAGSWEILPSAYTNLADTLHDFSAPDTISLVAGTYTLRPSGDAAVTVAAGTATITGNGQATAAAPVTFVVTADGTVTLTLDSGTLTQTTDGHQVITLTAGTATNLPAIVGTRAADVPDAIPLELPDTGTIVIEFDGPLPLPNTSSDTLRLLSAQDPAGDDLLYMLGGSSIVRSHDGQSLVFADLAGAPYVDALAVAFEVPHRMIAYRTSTEWVTAPRYFMVNETTNTTLASLRARLVDGSTADLVVIGANDVRATVTLGADSDSSINLSAAGLTTPFILAWDDALVANTALQQFYCNSNQLTGAIPDLSANTALQQFQCHSNQLTGAIPDLSANTALQQFQCHNNQLTGAIPDLSANTALLQFFCYNNQLTGAIPDLSANTALQRFYCYVNQLTGAIPDLVS
jgi:hypothetical protein